MPRPLDGHKLLRVVRSLRLTEREGVDADQYVSATLRSPSTWQEHVGEEVGVPGRKLTLLHRLDDVSSSVRLVEFLDQLAASTVSRKTEILTEIGEDLESSVYLALAGHYRQAMALLRFACENTLLDIFLRLRRRHDSWKQGELFVPSGNHLIKEVVPKHFALHQELKAHILELSRHVHTQRLEVTNRDMFVGFQPARFDLWFDAFRRSAVLITKIFLTFHTLRSEGPWAADWRLFRLGTGRKRADLEREIGDQHARH
jgi:hypothetical protein